MTGNTGKTGGLLRQRAFGLTNNQLKIIAMLSMLIDHVGMVLFPAVGVLRTIGRLAFPIFAFMIAEGCAHTRSRRDYLLKIGAMALICQIVYAIAEQSLYQSVMVTFTLSILTIYGIDGFLQKKNALSFATMVAAMAAVVFMTFIGPEIFSGTDFAVDYGFWGVLLPIAVYYIPSRQGKILATALILTMLGITQGGRQWYALLAVPVLMLYNGRRGKLNLKYLFYVFYPAHLGIIYLIDML